LITDKNKYDDGKEKEEEKRVRKGRNTERYGGMQDMTTYKLGEVESRFADMIWEREPLTMRELVELCEKELHWKRTTTYTVLKKLSEHGIFQMKEKQVTSLISREDYYAGRSAQFVQETFRGSLPAFIAAFTKRRALTEEEISEIREMIDGCSDKG
jgi:BlaI family penicillinase repressor